MDPIAFMKLAGGAAAAVIVAWAFITEQVVPGAAYRRERDRADRAEERLKDSIPVLQRAGETTERSAELANAAVETSRAAVEAVKQRDGRVQ